jgi:hypothetical protein
LFHSLLPHILRFSSLDGEHETISFYRQTPLDFILFLNAWREHRLSWKFWQTKGIACSLTVFSISASIVHQGLNNRWKKAGERDAVKTNSQDEK